MSEEYFFNLIFVIEKENGNIIHLTKIVSQEEDIPKIYITQFDTSVVGTFAGMSHDHIPCRRFFIKVRSFEEDKYTSFVNDLLSSGWVFSYDSFLD